MPDPSGARVGAEDASTATTENPADDARRLRRLRADVEQTRRVRDDLGDAPATVEAKYNKVTKARDAELKEARKMVTEAERAVKDAEKALTEAEKGA